MRKEIYVYAVEGTTQELEQWALEFLGSPLWHWVADGAELLVGEGMPAEWKSQGALFNERGELRWWRRKGAYEALLLSEEPVPDREPLPGQWECILESVFLQSLDDKRVRPNFTAYPGGRKDGRIEVRLCYRDGKAVFVSLRKFAKEE